MFIKTHNGAHFASDKAKKNSKIKTTCGQIRTPSKECKYGVLCTICATSLCKGEIIYK